MVNLTVVNQDGKLLVDSRDVAEMTGKRHDHLIRDIDGYVAILNQTPSLGADNFFIESYYEAGTGKSYKCYLLTRKGCDMVANKMTGKKGVLFTAAYVTKFEEMERTISMQQPLPSYMIDDPIGRAEKWIQERKERDALETKSLMLEQRVKEYEPKASYVDEILQSKNTVTVTQIAKDYGLTGQELNNILHEEKVQYKLNGQWLLYQKHQDKGYTKSNTVDIYHKNGERSVKMNTRWTQRGRLFIHELLNKRGIQPYMDRREISKAE